MQNQLILGNQVGNQTSSRIALHTNDHIHLIHTKEILRCESDGSYTRFFTVSDDVILVTRVLGHYEKQLEACGFLRVHRSHLINVHQITSIDKRDGMFVRMRDGALVPVSSRKRKSLLDKIEHL